MLALAPLTLTLVWHKGIKGKKCRQSCGIIGKKCDDSLIKEATLDSKCSALVKMFPRTKCMSCSPPDSSDPYCFPGTPDGSLVYFHKTFGAKGFTCDTVPDKRVTPACPCY